MPTLFSGGCACGAIRYECSAAPVVALNCHCRDCQRVSGSAFCSVLYVPRTALTISGQSQYYEFRAASGNRVSRGFCPHCGAPVFLQAELAPDLQGLRAGSLDDPSWFRPQMQVWTARAQPWDHIDPALPRFAKEPTEEQLQAILTARG